MKSVWVSTLVVGTLVLSNGPWVQAENRMEYTIPDKQTLMGKVVYSEDVGDIPAEFMGSWQRTRVLLSSTFPNDFNTFEVGYWTFSKQGKELTLNNPETGAYSTMILDYVQNNTVQFHYLSSWIEGYSCYEELQLTLNGNQFNGIQKKTCSLGEGKTYEAFAKVTGEPLEQNKTASMFLQ